MHRFWHRLGGRIQSIIGMQNKGRQILPPLVLLMELHAHHSDIVHEALKGGGADVLHPSFGNFALLRIFRYTFPAVSFSLTSLRYTLR